MVVEMKAVGRVGEVRERGEDARRDTATARARAATYDAYANAIFAQQWSYLQQMAAATRAGARGWIGV